MAGMSAVVVPATAACSIKLPVVSWASSSFLTRTRNSSLSPQPLSNRASHSFGATLWTTATQMWFIRVNYAERIAVTNDIPPTSTWARRKRPPLRPSQSRVMRNVRNIVARCRRRGPCFMAPRWKRPPEQCRQLRKLKRADCSARDVFGQYLIGEPRRMLWAVSKQWGRMKLADR